MVSWLDKTHNITIVKVLKSLKGGLLISYASESGGNLLVCLTGTSNVQMASSLNILSKIVSSKVRGILKSNEEEKEPPTKKELKKEEKRRKEEGEGESKGEEKAGDQTQIWDPEEG